MSHWGLYVIRVNHFLKSTLNVNEDEAIDSTHSSLNTTPRVRTGISLPDFLPFPRIVRGPACPGHLWIWYPFSSSYFPVFDTLNAICALRAGWGKRYPFYAFLLTRMMYRPQWDPPPPRDTIMMYEWFSLEGNDPVTLSLIFFVTFEPNRMWFFPKMETNY